MNKSMSIKSTTVLKSYFESGDCFAALQFKASNKSRFNGDEKTRKTVID